MRRHGCLLLGSLALLMPGLWVVAQSAVASATVVLRESYVEGYKGSGGFQAHVTVTGSGAPDRITVRYLGAAVVVEDPGGVTAGVDARLSSMRPLRGFVASRAGAWLAGLSMVALVTMSSMPRALALPVVRAMTRSPAPGCFAAATARMR